MKCSTTYKEVIDSIMAHKPSQLKKGKEKSLRVAIDEKNDVFIQDNFKHISPGILLMVYSDFKKLDEEIK